MRKTYANLIIQFEAEEETTIMQLDVLFSRVLNTFVSVYEACSKS